MPSNTAIERERTLHEQAIKEGSHHLAALHQVRLSLLTGTFGEGSPGSGLQPIVAPWKKGIQPAPTAVAFLAAFTQDQVEVCLMLKQGVNRLGKDPSWGDHSALPPGVRVMEGRQWLVVCTPPQAIVADDHSTNQSLVLPSNLPALSSGDPRFGQAPFSGLTLLQIKPAGSVALDWSGDTVHTLSEGDVLVTAYAAFVFGWVP